MKRPFTPGPQPRDDVSAADARAVQQRVAQYVLAMSEELGALAAGAQFRMLRYLLEMVELEAQALLDASEDGRSPSR